MAHQLAHSLLRLGKCLVAFGAHDPPEHRSPRHPQQRQPLPQRRLGPPGLVYSARITAHVRDERIDPLRAARRRHLHVVSGEQEHDATALDV